MRMKKILLFLMATIVEFVANATTVTFDFTENAYGLPNDQSTYVTTPTTIELDGVSILLNQNTETSGWRMWNDGLRAYYKNEPYFTVTAGDEVIKGVSWTVVSGATFALDGTSEDITSWEGEETSVTFVYTNTSKNLALKTLTVTYGEDAEVPEIPETPEYTVTETIEAINSGYTGEVIVTGIVTRVTYFNANYGSLTYYISDDGTTDNELQVYGGLGLDGAKFESEEDIEVRATVKVKGSVKLYNGTPEIDLNSVILEYTAPNAGGIEDILIEDSIVTYYNLLGVRVDNPTPGIYLARTSKGFTKVAIR